MLGPIHPIQPSFAAGELAPPVRTRVDLDKRDIGLDTCSNFITRPHGGVVNRPGFEFYAETKDSSKRSRLIPFVFSMDSSECYALEVGDKYMRFFTGDGPIVLGADDPIIPAWSASATYQTGDFVRWGGAVYKCISGPVTGYGAKITGATGIATNFTTGNPPAYVADNNNDTYWMSLYMGEQVYSTGTSVGLRFDSAKAIGKIVFTQSTSWANRVVAVEVCRRVGTEYVALATKTGIWGSYMVTIELPVSAPPVESDEWLLRATLAGAPFNNIPTDNWKVHEVVMYPVSTPADDGTHWEAQSTYELVTTFAEADLPSLRYIQSADVLYLTHHDYPIMTLNRYGHANWVLSSFPYEMGPFQPVNDNEDVTVKVTADGTGPFDPETTVTVTANTNIFTEDMVGSFFMAEHLTPGWIYEDCIPGGPPYTGTAVRVRGKWVFRTRKGGRWTSSKMVLQKSFDDKTTWTDFKVLSDQVTTSWLIEGREDTEDCWLRVYRESPDDDNPCYTIEVPDFREQVVVKITGYSTAKVVTGKLQNRVEKLGNETDVWAHGAWSSKWGYPAVAAFYQERMVFANTPTDPQTLWMSRSGDYPDFGTSLPSLDDDALDIPIPSREVNAITGMVPLTDLIVMSAGGSWKVGPGSGNEAVTPKNRVAKPQNYTRASSLPPLVVGNRVVYLEAMNGKVFDLGYSLEDDSYMGQDLSVLSEHLFEGHHVVDWAFQQAPYSVIWAVRDDGVLLGMTYLREHKVVAWHHHHTDGAFEAICTIPGDGEDQLFAIVNRTVGGATKRYIERLHSRRFATLADAFFVDSGLSYVGDPVTNVSGLGHLEGKTVVALADGVVVRDLVVVDGAIDLPFAASKIHVGLPYTADLCTLEDAMELKDGISIPKRKNNATAHLMLNGSMGGSVGPDADHLTPIEYADTTALYTGRARVLLESHWEDEGKVFVRQSDPLPLSVDGVIRRVNYGG